MRQLHPFRLWLLATAATTMLLPSPVRSASANPTQKTTEAGREALGYYHERRDENRNVGLRPEHSWASHAADACCLDGMCTCGPRNGAAAPALPRARHRSRIRFTIRRCRQSWFEDRAVIVQRGRAKS